MSDISPVTGMDISHNAPQWAEGGTLIGYLSVRLIRESKTRLRRLIAGGEIRINGCRVNSSAALAAGDRIQMPSTLRTDGPADVGLDIEVLFEDGDHIVLNKPSGLSVPPYHNRDEPQLHDWLLMAFNRDAPPEGPYVRPYIVHRLDRETSGVLLAAKHPEAAAMLSGQFQKRTVRKEYRAIVEGVFPRDEYIADIPLRKASASAIAMVPDGRKGKEAMTEISVLTRYRHFTLLALRPLTGRQHQLRVHMSALGYPLAVDFLYGRRESLTGSGLQRMIGRSGEGLRGFVLDRTPLHASTIGYRLPADSGPVERRAAVPADMKAMLELLDMHDRD